jgi:hypothetical protein
MASISTVVKQLTNDHKFEGSISGPNLEKFFQTFAEFSKKLRHYTKFNVI